MAKITVYTPNGIIISKHDNAEFDSTDIGIDTPESSYTSIQTPTSTVEFFGDVIVRVEKQKKEDE